MIDCIIVEDEKIAAQHLQRLIEQENSLMLRGVFFNAADALNYLSEEIVDLIFLDVEMPWMNGFEMLEMLDHIDFGIIFTTAYDKFAARAFRISAVDYLLKPIDASDLKAAVKKAEEKMLSPTGTVNIENLLHNIRQPVQEQKIAFPNRDGYEFAQANSILYCSAEGAYTKVVLNNKHSLLISKTLGDIEEMLPPEIFIRIHHSTIVNINVVTHYIRTDGGYVVLNTNEKLMVSKARKDALLQRLGLKT